MSYNRPVSAITSNRPQCQSSNSRQQFGMVGWGVQNPQLTFKTTLRPSSVKRDHLRIIDRQRNEVFTQLPGTFSGNLDSKLKIDQFLYQALNMTAQRLVVKDAGIKYNAFINDEGTALRELQNKINMNKSMIQQQQQKYKVVIKPSLSNGRKKIKRIVNVNRNTLPVFQTTSKNKNYPDIINQLSNPFQRSGLGLNANTLPCQTLLKKKSLYYKNCKDCSLSMSRMSQVKNNQLLKNLTSQESDQESNQTDDL